MKRTDDEEWERYTMVPNRSIPPARESDGSRAGESKDDREALRVRILGLKKVFPGRGGAPSKVAVSPLYLGINEHECLGLLVSGYRMCW